MSTENPQYPTPATLTQPLTLTFAGLGLESLNAYRLAKHALLADPDGYQERIAELEKAQTNLLFWIDATARKVLGEPQGL